MRGVCIALLLFACGDDDAEPEAEAQAEEIVPEEAAEEPALEAPRRVFFDLVKHRARASLHHGDALLVDFGTPAAAQHTLGGWRTRVGDDHVFGDVTTTLIDGVTGELLLPAASFAAARLTMRLRAFADGRLTVYLDGETVAHARLPTDGSFETVSVDLDEGDLKPGENMLQLRVPGVGRDDGVRAGIAVDWLRLEPATEERAVPPIVLAGEELELPAGWSLRWPFEVPERARLAIEAEGRFEVRVHRDGAEVETLAPPFELRERAGDVVALEIVAREDLRIDRARIETPAPEVAERTMRRIENVLVFLVDTVRADRLKPWNPETRVRTPGLEAWTARAAVFERGATQENWTKPSVATLLSGLLPWEHTATSGEAVLPRSVEMLSETLKDDGFHTGAFICNGYVSDAFGFEQGWSTWRNYIREGRRSQARFVAADVLQWLDERPEEKPFFLYVHTIDPHVPYIPPPELLAEYDPEPYEGPVDFREDRELLEKIKVGSIRLNARDRRRLEALYDGEITYHDIHFASVLEGLERRGLRDSTLVVFTADHGEEFFDHDSVGHGHSLYEELLHVPLVMEVPGLTEGGVRVEESVGLVDVVPTILEALGREVPAELTGRSALPLLRGQSSDAPRASVAGFMNGWRSVRVGHRKLIQRTHRRTMLFDLEDDPGETRDLTEERPLELRYLRGLLGLALAGHTRPAHRAEATEIDDEMDAQLRALGYVGTQRR